MMKVPRSNFAIGIGLIAVTALAASPAAADEAATRQSAPSLASGQVYEAGYFARFTPRTALDMLKQVPGFAIRASDDARGLGQASGNVLINRQRISGKSDDASTQISRIAAANVVRIELLDGATLGIPGLSGQVANIVTHAGGVTGRFEWKPEFRPHFTDPVLTRGEVSISGSSGRIEYTLGLSNNGGFGGAGGPTRILRADGSLIERRHDRLDNHFYRPKATANLTLHGAGSDIGHLNLAGYAMWYRHDESGRRSGPGLPDRRRIYRERQHGGDYEVGADYEFGLGPGRLKLIGLERHNKEPFTDTSLIFPLGDVVSGDRYAEAGHTHERIGRAEYSWKMLGGDWQASGEAAFNSLHNRARLFDYDPQLGDFVPIPFPEGIGAVSEDRYEVLLSHTRRLAPKLTLQLTGGAEFSRLSQSGAASAVRRFRRPKGALNLAWTPRAGTDISFKVERKVGQLDFYDFLARVFINEGNANAGNVELVPPQSWEFELTGKHDLGRWGTTSVTVFDREIQDLVDIIPVGSNGGQSPGNIAHAVRRGIEWTSTLELAPLGVAGAKLDFHTYLERSRVRDPLTGRSRPISDTNDIGIDFKFRHDIPATQWAYGADFSYDHTTLAYRLTQVGREYEGPNWLAFYVENKDVLGLTVNARFSNVLNARSRWNRVVYAGFRDRSPVLFVERRDRLIGPIFTFTVKGTF